MRNQGGAKLECFCQGKGVGLREVDANYSLIAAFIWCSLYPGVIALFFCLLLLFFPPQKGLSAPQKKTNFLIDKATFPDVDRSRADHSSVCLLLLRYFWTAEASGHLRRNSLPHQDFAWLFWASTVTAACLFFCVSGFACCQSDEKKRGAVEESPVCVLKPTVLHAYR